MKKIIILKIIFIISFLSLTPLHQDGFPLFAMMLVWVYQFIADLFTVPFDKIFWEGLLVIPIVGTLIVAMLCKRFKDRNLLLFCITTLFLFVGYTLVFSFDGAYFHVGFLWFIVPLVLFVISSILLLHFNFKKQKVKIA